MSIISRRNFIIVFGHGKLDILPALAVTTFQDGTFFLKVRQGCLEHIYFCVLAFHLDNKFVYVCLLFLQYINDLRDCKRLLGPIALLNTNGLLLLFACALTMISFGVLASFGVFFGIGGVFLILFDQIISRLVIPGNLNEEISKDQNWGYALIAASIMLSTSLAVDALLFDFPCPGSAAFAKYEESFVVQPED